MSREHNLYSYLIKVEKNDREDLLETLRSLADFDNDFNGVNGIDYTWKEAIENGFESNLEYLLNEVKDIKDDKECVEEFVDGWIKSDINYYHDYNVDYLIDENGCIYAIALAVVCGY